MVAIWKSNWRVVMWFPGSIRVHLRLVVMHLTSDQSVWFWVFL